jgi:crossover junction endodeoxyribonuclease RuvC
MPLGFDPSLTSSGFAYTDADGEIHTGTIRGDNIRGIDRLLFIRQSFAKLLNMQPDPLVVYEGYAMGGKGQRGRFFDMGELGGVLKSFAIEAGFDILLVPPSNLKMFATERGNAKKPEISAAIAEIWGYRVKQDDEADAFVLMKMGEAFRDRRRHRTYSEIRRNSLLKCQLIRGQRG